MNNITQSDIFMILVVALPVMLIAAHIIGRWIGNLHGNKEEKDRYRIDKVSNPESEHYVAYYLRYGWGWVKIGARVQKTEEEAMELIEAHKKERYLKKNTTVETVKEI
jgi:hypothetical protein